MGLARGILQRSHDRDNADNHPSYQPEQHNNLNQEDLNRSKSSQNDEEEPSSKYDLIKEEEEEEEEIYLVKQQRGYLAILFSITQVIILIAMMIECKIAPMQINPMVGPYPDALSYWGGKNAYFILNEEEWWRLITPIFLHAGIFHLMGNVSVQLDTGAFFEREWGSFVWLIIYLSSALGGSVLSTIVIPNTVGVGSSGAVCGLFGGKLAEALCRCCESTKTQQAKISRNVLKKHTCGSILSVIVIGLFSFVPYVDWAAHLGGLLGGLSVGLMIFACRIKTLFFRLVWFLLGAFITVVGFSVSITYMIEEKKDEVAAELADVCGYYMQHFENYECNCMLDRHQE
eukprot:CAMPEP_0184860824 /NCGR_PEP_ID=MMETSP0580-20130426/5640_1 /TAXON_ID=1118495 /ORGANISM="Dactyliosolen fragilissimus" /LENGTH=343 /DNA_ID=CAMNT_0027358077 /DNA_START=35 /DNA_END=1066 /DNA_ORIENTATION=+